MGVRRGPDGEEEHGGGGRRRLQGEEQTPHLHGETEVAQLLHAKAAGGELLMSPGASPGATPGATPGAVC